MRFVFWYTEIDEIYLIFNYYHFYRKYYRLHHYDVDYYVIVISITIIVLWILYLSMFKLDMQNAKLRIFHFQEEDIRNVSQYGKGLNKNSIFKFSFFSIVRNIII